MYHAILTMLSSTVRLGSKSQTNRQTDIYSTTAIKGMQQATGLTMGVFDWASSVTYVLTDWTFLTSLYSTGTGNEEM